MQQFYSATCKAGLIFVLSCSLQLVNAQTKTANLKIFEGRNQYRTWSVGLNAGVLSPAILTGGERDYSDPLLKLGYDVFVRKQLGHAFGLEADFLRGHVAANHDEAAHPNGNINESFDAELGWAISLSGVANVATVDFLRRKNSVNFLVKAGLGFTGYAYTYTDEHVFETKGTYGPNFDQTYLKKKFIPVGLGAKFRASERINFNLGYTMYFLNADNLDGLVAGKNNDHWSYSTAGVELSLGKKTKQNLDWVNPLVIMYDELKDPEIRKELTALTNRVSSLENMDLLKDGDGDGVADKLDKCPNTEAGIRVDGAGCPLDADADGLPDSKDSCPTEKGTAEFNGCPRSTEGRAGIHFEFNSAVLRTDDYAYLDQLVSEFKAENVREIVLEGHASEEGTADYNVSLSKDRANAVKTYLVNSGVAANKIATKGFGETRPVASNATEEGRQQNRRVEIKRQ